MSYQEDAKFVGAFIRGGSWEVGLRVARNVTVDAGRGGRNGENSPNRVSLRDFARDAGVDHNTIAKYLAAWEWCAKDGWVPRSVDLAPDETIPWPDKGYDQADWQVYYRKACDNAPPWNPDRKPLEPRKPPFRNVSRESIADAVRTDSRAAEAAREALRERAAQAELDTIKRGGKVAPPAERPVDAVGEALSAEADTQEAIAEYLAYTKQYRRSVEPLIATMVSFGRLPSDHEEQQLKQVNDILTELIMETMPLLSLSIEDVRR